MSCVKICKGLTKNPIISLLNLHGIFFDHKKWKSTSIWNTIFNSIGTLSSKKIFNYNSVLFFLYSCQWTLSFVFGHSLKIKHNEFLLLGFFLNHLESLGIISKCKISFSRISTKHVVHVQFDSWCKEIFWMRILQLY